jgi:hypothetical protein
MQQKEPAMPEKHKPGTETHTRTSSPITMLSEWARQGTESFFATQKILLELVMRQNANTFKMVKERFAEARSLPASALTEVAGEGLSNFIASQRVILHLAERQNEILMSGVEERVEAIAPLSAVTGLVHRGIDTFIEMQQHFLTLAAKQADAWIEAGKSGDVFNGQGMAELARESVENFVRSQKKFLDAVAEETSHATGKTNGKRAEARNTELAEMAREAAEAFIDAQKKLLDVAAQQMAVSVATVRRSVDIMNPLPPAALADLTRQTVDTFVSAQKALLDIAAKPPRAAAHKTPPPAPKGKKQAKAKVAHAAA